MWKLKSGVGAAQRDFCFHVKRTMLDVADEKERQHTIIVNRWFHFISKVPTRLAVNMPEGLRVTRCLLRV